MPDDKRAVLEFVHQHASSVVPALSQ
jgi:hypothetical protein